VSVCADWYLRVDSNSQSLLREVAWLRWEASNDVPIFRYISNLVLFRICSIVFCVARSGWTIFLCTCVRVLVCGCVPSAVLVYFCFTKAFSICRYIYICVYVWLLLRIEWPFCWQHLITVTIGFALYIWIKWFCLLLLLLLLILNFARFSVILNECFWK